MNGRQKTGNEGFTLIEVMLSIMILALISIPLMHYFTDSLKYANQTAEKQKATLIAQETAEAIKGQKKIVKWITSSITTTPDPDNPLATPVTVSTSGYDLVPELKSVFAGAGAISQSIPTDFADTGATTEAEKLVYKFIDQKSKKYGIEVTLDCQTLYADAESPVVYGIDDSRNVVIVERAEEQEALMYFQALNTNRYVVDHEGFWLEPDVSPSPTPDGGFEYFTTEPSAGPSATPESHVVPYDEDELFEKMRREINISISRGVGESYYMVNAWYQYYCDEIYGPETETEEYATAALIDTSIQDIEGIYLMFNKVSDTTDIVNIEWNVAGDGSSDPVYPEFRFVCQNLGAAPAEDEESSSAYALTVRLINFAGSSPVFRSNILPTTNVSIVEPNDVGVDVEKAGAVVRSLTEGGLPVRIFDVDIKVYKNEAAMEAGTDWLVHIQTSKVE